MHFVHFGTLPEGKDKTIGFEFTIIPRNSKTHFLKFITEPRCCRRKIRRSSKNTQIIKHLSTDIGTFDHFTKFLVLGTVQNRGKGTRTSFLPSEILLIFDSPCVVVHWNMHPLNRFCTCNCIFAIKFQTIQTLHFEMLAGYKFVKVFEIDYRSVPPILFSH